MSDEPAAAIAVIGRACRLPGANSVGRLWDLISAGQCAVSRIPADRWSLERFGHPRQKERGCSYSWAAGVLDDVWGFDPAPFGISPREAEQMDPQQRLLLELAWEAMEDAGIRPSALAGEQTGVYVGGSSLDYGNLRLHDPAAADAYFATGNTLAVLSNRISYVFDLHGPSCTIDTACSSSLVALDAAVAALRAGSIDTAVVAGVNMLTSPFGFISFSQATMLSPTGLCRAFAGAADGYVRAEGGVVLVLRAFERARAEADRAHALIVGCGVNSDGRTAGISLPSRRQQAALLERTYAKAGVDPNRVAFIEAHGAGTPVGDPVEAAALGDVLGQKRARPLAIGSIKTNIGHTEPASGLAGLLKAMLALEHDILPQSLHCETPNPAIPFADLNLGVCAAPLALERDGRPRYAGVSSFGFGGANAHVILTDAPNVPPSNADARAPQFLLLSAQCRDALAALARQYADRLAGSDPVETRKIVAACGHRRELLPERLVVPFGEWDALIRTLEEAADGRAGSSGSEAAVARAAPVAFVFSGNGSQWPGMGRSAYEADALFRARFDEIDIIFHKLAGWSLIDAMFDPEIATELKLTSVAQPLVFAIQAATTHSLTRLGLQPAMVLGHSMGEIAAAEAAGILDLENAVRVVYFRSKRQEIVRGAGGVAVLFGAIEAAEALVGEISGLSIAARNSPGCFTMAGPFSALDRAAKEAPGHKARLRLLDLAYPFHNDLMLPVEGPLLADLDALRRRPGKIAFISTVAADVVSGPELDARYWWRNVHEPVRFMEAVGLAIRLGAKVFVKIGPGATLVGDIKLIAERMGASIGALSVHRPTPVSGDPCRDAVAQALALGARVDEAIAFGANPRPAPDLPLYPWRRTPYRLAETCEATGLTGVRLWRPLIGARPSPDALEWRARLDPLLAPELADHRIGGQVLLPGAAFVEMALAVARDWLGSDVVAISDLEILQPMIFAPGASRDILCRATPIANMIEIMSRTRLSGASWVSHAKAKVVHNPASSIGTPATMRQFAKSIAGADLYAEARRSGLDFGPAYRQVAAASQIDADTIIVELVEAEAGAEYGLDPARLDACFHGLILLFSDLAPARPQGDQVAYVPVRFEEARLDQPGAAIARAAIEIKRRDESAIVADFTLLDRDGDLIARLRGARFQAMRARPADDLASYAVAQGLALAAEPTAMRQDPPLATAQLAPEPSPETGALGDLPAQQDHLLIEGWATAAAHRLALALAVKNTVDPDQLIAAGRVLRTRRRWLVNLLRALEQSGLAKEAAMGAFSLAEGFSLPDPAAVLRALAADHPKRSSELLLAARVGAALDALAAGATEIDAMSASAVEAFEVGSASAAASADLLAHLLARPTLSWPRDRALRILQVAHGPLSPHSVALARLHEAWLTIFDADQSRLEQARLAFAGDASITFIDSLDNVPKNSFDLVVAADSLHRIASSAKIFAKIVDAMASEASIAAVEPDPSLFRDLAFGLREDWFRKDQSAGGAILPPAGWSARFSAAGLNEVIVQKVATEAGPALFLAGRKPRISRRRYAPGKALVIIDRDPRTSVAAAALSERLAIEGADCPIVRDDQLDEIRAAQAATIVFLASPAPHSKTSVQSLAARCLALKRCVESLSHRKARLWIVSSGATRADPGTANPIEAGFWAFTRTFANEFQAHDFRRIDVAPNLQPQLVAERLAEIIVSGTPETDIVLDRNLTRVARLHPQNRERLSRRWPAAPASRLEKGDGAGLDRVRWAPIRRQRPGPGEVEIAVAATGLNFRDVMWALSVLPDEMLEGGFAGATLGLECAGHISRVGPGTKECEVGDRVLAFAGGAFATHVAADSRMVAKIPEGISLEAAATIPVAFLTAYYALVVRARLQCGEWVLIHGGAGGVGLAALQIARWRGARVIATAGSAEKRDLCVALGAEHAFDSRSGAFVDAARRAAPGGVDVVLNNLSGEAMERSIGLLAPFGRFVELGKRDYQANAHVGLRPFRNNLAYFGVDLDQLVLTQRDMGHDLFQDVMKLFAEGILSPLPYRVFPARESVGAMRLMQQSGHIGKIIVTPPGKGEIRVAPLCLFKAAPDKTHLVTGGLNGFGLETARWLVERGARHLVLVGRSGAASPAAAAFLTESLAAGAAVRAEAVDVADRAAVGALFAKIGREMPPLGGVVHAAMVLDDALIANLEPEQFESVLRPKILGAEYLDQMTRNMPLDYFVMFSSAAAAIGNPGQASYVAANGFLEGLARQRKAAGRPALAIAWGAIEDAGVLARNRSVRDALASRIGLQAMPARRALDFMGEALSRDAAREDAALVIAQMNWAIAREHLPLLRSPTFSELIREDASVEAGRGEKIDLLGLIATRPHEDVRKTVIAIVAEEIAHILRLPQKALSHARPLAEVGLDSLMAVELAVRLEVRLTLEPPLSKPASSFNVVELSDHILALCVNSAEAGSAERDLGERHLGKDIDPAALAPLSALVEEKSRVLTRILS